jgi:hypothetical protein
MTEPLKTTEKLQKAIDKLKKVEQAIKPLEKPVQVQSAGIPVKKG